MSNKRIRLPKDGQLEPDRQINQDPAGLEHADDVEGHGFVNPAPPAEYSKRGPSSGGEFVGNQDDGKAASAD
jgi:hypothetical protein